MVLNTGQALQLPAPASVNTHGVVAPRLHGAGPESPQHGSCAIVWAKCGLREHRRRGSPTCPVVQPRPALAAFETKGVKTESSALGGYCGQYEMQWCPSNGSPEALRLRYDLEVIRAEGGGAENVSKGIVRGAPGQSLL